MVYSTMIHFNTRNTTKLSAATKYQVECPSHSYDSTNIASNNKKVFFDEDEDDGDVPTINFLWSSSSSSSSTGSETDEDDVDEVSLVSTELSLESSLERMSFQLEVENFYSEHFTTNNFETFYPEDEDSFVGEERQMTPALSNMTNDGGRQHGRQSIQVISEGNVQINFLSQIHPPELEEEEEEEGFETKGRNTPISLEIAPKLSKNRRHHRNRNALSSQEFDAIVSQISDLDF